MIRPERFQPAGSLSSDSSCGSSQDGMSTNDCTEQAKEPTLQSSPCVCFWKLLVVFMLLGAAAVTAAFAYISLYQVDSEEMTTSFEMLALNLQETATGIWNGYKDELTSIGSTIATTVQGPLTVDQWETISGSANVPEFVAYCPLVSDTTNANVQPPKFPFQYMTPRNEKIANMGANSFPELKPLIETATATKALIVGQVSKRLASSLFRQDINDLDIERSLMVQPVYDKTTDNSSHQRLAGLVVGEINWANFMTRLIRQGVVGVHVVLEDSCNDGEQVQTAVSTYGSSVSSETAVYLGTGDQHKTKYDEWHHAVHFLHNSDSSLCTTILHLYPTSEFSDLYYSVAPAFVAGLAGGSFLLIFLAFLVYDRSMYRKNATITRFAERSNAIVATLFPTNFRDRLMEGSNQAGVEMAPVEIETGRRSSGRAFVVDKSSNDDTESGDKPIAELYPETTIMMADLVGFTAWSSVRKPEQVFSLLETVFSEFDIIAARRRVFKVETVGDCYVAVAGLPNPRKEHAVVMARFANDCLRKFDNVTKKLERTLGPDTGDLCLRIGLHSGPTTAGILRGPRSRFQLFGDTINTASRMESTSMEGRIQVSHETADLIAKAGKGYWLTKRDTAVEAKGKGEMECFWLTVKGSSGSQHGSISDGETESNLSSTGAEESTEFVMGEGEATKLPSRLARLVEWNSECFCDLLKQVVQRREEVPFKLRGQDESPETAGVGKNEVKEFIELPQYQGDLELSFKKARKVRLKREVKQQLREYITNICCLYRSNDFHNFEHASHVTMSVLKLLGRVVSPYDAIESPGKRRMSAQKMHYSTFGITSDPLLQLACVFAALIHDVDHCGVPNTQLIKENPHLAELYNNKSVAEQNSLDISWKLLMQPNFKDLREAIFATDAERNHFRQLTVNVVLATDIMDKELKEFRNQRWDRAFSEKPRRPSAVRDNSHRKAMIVIEHLIQASDISHTMQHWHIFKKWNSRLFKEMLAAYHAGRAEKDPSEFWYEGEIGFFDFYVIPLAKKLKDCGVFGVSSDEYLNYAVSNRNEWFRRGKEIVAEMKERCLLEIAAECKGVPSPGPLVARTSDQSQPGALFQTLEWSTTEDHV